MILKCLALALQSTDGICTILSSIFLSFSAVLKQCAAQVANSGHFWIHSIYRHSQIRLLHDSGLCWVWQSLSTDSEIINSVSYILSGASIHTTGYL